MARQQQNKRRQRADESSSSDTELSAKESKTRSEIELEAWRSWKNPPEFWDRLSKIELTRRALEEFDRRTRAQRSHSTRHSRLAPFRTISTSKDLARFARHGGPDLRSLRGYPYPRTDHQNPDTMSAGPSSQTKSTKVKTKKTSAYDRGFELHLDENGVKPTYSSQKPDLAELEEALEVNRTSLAPSTFLDGDFEKFRERNSRAKDETDVRETVMPTIVGPDPPYFTARNTVFGNLDSLTDGTIVVPKPDIYDGAVPKELDRTIRNQLAGHIVPSTMVDKPMAPNFFVEVKGPDGASAVAARQARYDGAIGARGMHSLQNHGREEPQYDGRPYTYTSTYQDSTLKLYAHHLTAPTTEGGQPEYHMTQVKGFDMTNDRETFVKGATAFRNARDLAKGHRDTFIQEANARASHGHAAELDEEE